MSAQAAFIKRKASGLEELGQLTESNRLACVAQLKAAPASSCCSFELSSLELTKYFEHIMSGMCKFCGMVPPVLILCVSG